VTIKDKLSNELVPIETGQQALFALLYRDMENLAYKYNNVVETEDCIKIFYEVSCDRNKLVQVLHNLQCNYKIKDTKKLD